MEQEAMIMSLSPQMSVAGKFMNYLTKLTSMRYGIHWNYIIKSIIKDNS